MTDNRTNARFASLFVLLEFSQLFLAPSVPGQTAAPSVQLPNGRLLGEVPGKPRQTNNLATAASVSPDGRFIVFLHSGYGSAASDGKQSLSVLNLETGELADFPD